MKLSIQESSYKIQKSVIREMKKLNMEEDKKLFLVQLLNDLQGSKHTRDHFELAIRWLGYEIR